MSSSYYIDNIQVFPLNAGTEKFSFEKKDNSFLFNKTLTTQIIFHYTNGGFNFKYQFEENKCQELKLRIINNCSQLEFEGFFTVAEGDFDDDKCLFSVQPNARDFIIEDVSVNIFDEPNRVFEGGFFGVYTGFGAIENCRYFDKLILYLAKQSNPRINNIISNFFQINPDDSFYIPGVTNVWQYMAFASLSDVQSPLPTEQATRELTTFRNVMQDLNSIFRVGWFIDAELNLRIEHEFYFEGALGIDLTTSQNKKFILGKRQFKLAIEDLPRLEKWDIIDHQNVTTLTYTGLNSIAKNKNEKVYSSLTIRTDTDRISNGFNQTVDGLVLFATDGGAFDGKWRDNNSVLSPDYLVPRIHMYNRPGLYANIASVSKLDNNITTAGGIILRSAAPIKEQTELKFPLCCQPFNAYEKIQTDVGIGTVQKAEYDSKTGMLGVTLRYGVNGCYNYSPNNFPGLSFWYKYNQGITTGVLGRVLQWDDASGNGRHATYPVDDGTGPQWLPNNPIWFQNISGSYYLTTPAFQLFPNKRGTILILLAKGGGDYGGSTGSFGDISVLSTNSISGGNYFDFSLLASPERFYSFTEAKNYPNNFTNNGLYVIRRPSDTNIYGRQNGVNSFNNPMQIANVQPTSEPLIIGDNPLVFTPSSQGIVFISEIIGYDRDLSEDEIEKIEIYLTKKGIYHIYPD